MTGFKCLYRKKGTERETKEGIEKEREEEGMKR
jgi:hypothetical protein